MRIISSQKFLNYEIVDEKIAEMEASESESITLPIINAGMKDLDGNDLYILVDGHHRKEAAEEMGITINYEEVANDYDLTGDDLLLTCYMDSDWYDVATGELIW